MAVLIVVAVLALLVALTVRAEARPAAAGPRSDVGEPRVDPASRVREPARLDSPTGATAATGAIAATGATGAAGAAGNDGDDDDDLDDVVALDGPCDDCNVATLAHLAAHAPNVAEVVATAQRAAGVASGDDPTPSWRRRSRWSSLVPWITVRAGNTQSWRDVDDPTLLTVHHAAAFDGRVAWHLDRLVFDPNEPRFTAFELSRRRERRKLAAIASRAYFTWLRAAIATERDTRWQLRLAEAEAELDALTDGWFSRAVADARGKVEPRATEVR